jgi:hypothetical protein
VRVRPQRGMKDEVGHSFSIIDSSIRLARFSLSLSLARSLALRIGKRLVEGKGP